MNNKRCLKALVNGWISLSVFAGVLLCGGINAHAAWSVGGNEYVNPTTIYPWTRIVVYFTSGWADGYDKIDEAYLKITYDGESTWTYVPSEGGKLASEGDDDSGHSEAEAWRVKGHIPAPGRDTSETDGQFKFTYHGKDIWSGDDWRDSYYWLNDFNNHHGSVAWDTDGAYHSAAATVDGQSYAYVTKLGETASKTSFTDAETAVLRTRAYKEDITVITHRYTGNWSGDAMSYVSGADYDNESDYNNSYTVEFWDTQISGDEWTTAINAGGSGNFSYNIKYTDGADEDYLKSSGMQDLSTGGTDFSITVTDDDSTDPVLTKESGTDSNYGPMRILLNGVDKRARGTGFGTKEFDLTDGELRSLSGANKLTFKFAAYDADSGLQRDSSGSSSTNMNYDIGEETGFLQDNFATYVSGSSAAGTSSGTAKWSVFEHSSAFTKDEVTQLYTNTASGTGTAGENKILLSVPDADSDRSSDQEWVTDDQMGFLNVIDDDAAVPQVVNIDSPDLAVGRPLHISIGGSSLSSSGSSTNKIYTTTDADLAAVAGGNQLIMRFGAIDSDSGLSRDAAGPVSENSNIDIGQAINNDYSHYDSGNSSTFEQTKDPAATNAWTWSSAFTGAQISNMVTEATDGVGTNKITLSIFDADDDRDNDGLIVTNHQYGFLEVTDDDDTAPTLVEMRVDYNGSELSSSGSGTAKIYTITDAELADIAGKGMKFKFSVWDASGLSRNASGSVLEDMNYDIGTDYTGDLSGLEDVFSTFDDGDADHSANPINSGSAEWSVFVHSANFSAAEIGHLATETDQTTTGKNLILLSAPDNDGDRDGDKAWQIDQQIGFLQVNDDDSAGPSFANATFSGKKLQIDITDGSGVYDPGSGGERLYMIYDDDGEVDSNTDGSIDLSPLAGDTYQADSDMSYADMDGKEITYRVYAYDNDGEHTSDRAQGIYNGSNLWDLNAPVATAASGIGSSGFTANWNAVTGADDYRLDVALSAVFGTALNDNFEDDDLTGWTQSTAGRFAATNDTPISGSISLHHVYDNASASHDQISYSTDGLDLTKETTTWRFQTKHTYNPSSGNNWGMFLLSDSAAAEMHPSGAADGYVAGVNYSGTDDNLKIWKITAGAATEVLDTTLDWETTITTANAAGVEVTRTAAGSWSVKVDTDGGFDNLVAQGGSASNTDYTNTAYFGVYYEYSSAQDQKLWVDDISITQPNMYVTGYSNKTVTGTSAAVAGLSAETDYYYRLRAASDAGALSDNSNVISATTTATSTPTGSIFQFR